MRVRIKTIVISIAWLILAAMALSKCVSANLYFVEEDGSYEEVEPGYEESDFA